jgi:hypothetical protein
MKIYLSIRVLPLWPSPLPFCPIFFYGYWGSSQSKSVQNKVRKNNFLQKNQKKQLNVEPKSLPIYLYLILKQGLLLPTFSSVIALIESESVLARKTVKNQRGIIQNNHESVAIKRKPEED